MKNLLMLVAAVMCGLLLLSSGCDESTKTADDNLAPTEQLAPAPPFETAPLIEDDGVEDDGVEDDGEVEIDTPAGKDDQ